MLRVAKSLARRGAASVTRAATTTAAPMMIPEAIAKAPISLYGENAPLVAAGRLERAEDDALRIELTPHDPATSREVRASLASTLDGDQRVYYDSKRGVVCITPTKPRRFWVASGDDDLEALADEIVARHGNPRAPAPRGRGSRNKVNKRFRRGQLDLGDHRAYFRRANISPMNRGNAAAVTWIPRRRVAATPRP